MEIYWKGAIAGAVTMAFFSAILDDYFAGFIAGMFIFLLLYTRYEDKKKG